MNDDMLVVNFAAMQQAVFDIGHAIELIDSELETLESDATPLTAQWSGTAQQAYRVQHDQWTAAADDLKAILVQISRALMDTTDDYSATEQGNASLFS
jgi:WXG100 family type VII secretion target